MRLDGWTLAIGVAKVSGLTLRTVRSRCRLGRVSDTEFVVLGLMESYAYFSFSVLCMEL